VLDTTTRKQAQIPNKTSALLQSTKDKEEQRGHMTIYSQTYIKRSPFGQRKSGLIRQRTSKKRFNSYEIFYDM